MKRETWLVLLVTMAVIAMSVVLVLDRNSVEIGFLEPTVEHRTFHGHERPPEVDSSSAGLTKWEFKCPAEIDYSVVDKIDDKGGSFARVKVTGVRVKLELPITVWLPENPSESLKMHEDGHVEICRRVYSEAKGKARSMAQDIIGKVYSGTGANLESACSLAINIPMVEFSGRYETEVARKAQDISEIYDYLNKYTDIADSELVEKAFATYEQGKPREIGAGPGSVSF